MNKMREKGDRPLFPWDNERRMFMRNLIDIKDLSVEEIDQLIEKAKDIMENKEKYS